MKLSDKAIRFLIEAAQFRAESMKRQLEMENLDEDARSYLINDSCFLDEIVTDLQTELAARQHRA